MLIVLFLCFAIIPIYGEPVDKLRGKTNSTTSISNKTLQTIDDKLTVASEGGAIISNTPKLSLPKGNQAFLMTSPADVSNNKVKARKGAPVEDIANTSFEQNHNNTILQQNHNSTSFEQTHNSSVIVQNPNSNVTHVKPNEISSRMNDTKFSTNSSLPKKKTTITKPPILSVELLEQADLNNSDPAVPEVDERKVKVHKSITNGHPGMITPIVITVLVVPIFAMIGYMALKRGQEAWKNRHYKRMDFLLDGMYND